MSHLTSRMTFPSLRILSLERRLSHNFTHLNTHPRWKKTHDNLPSILSVHFKFPTIPLTTNSQTTSLNDAISDHKMNFLKNLSLCLRQQLYSKGIHCSMAHRDNVPSRAKCSTVSLVDPELYQSAHDLQKNDNRRIMQFFINALSPNLSETSQGRCIPPVKCVLALKHN